MTTHFENECLSGDLVVYPARYGSPSRLFRFQKCLSKFRHERVLLIMACYHSTTKVIRCTEKACKIRRSPWWVSCVGRSVSSITFGKIDRLLNVTAVQTKLVCYSILNRGMLMKILHSTNLHDEVLIRILRSRDSDLICVKATRLPLGRCIASPRIQTS